MPSQLPARIHATTVALNGQAAVIRGPSGSGKSDLALRCLTSAPNALIDGKAQLVADDYTELYEEDGTLYARCPENIANLLEVRGIGLVDIPAVSQAKVALVIDLVDPKVVNRLPDPEAAVDLFGISVPSIELNAFEGSAPAKLLLALECLRRDGQLPRLPDANSRPGK